MRKKLLTIFGPILLAALMVLGVFLSPIRIGDNNTKLWSKASSSMSANVIRGNVIKNDAIASGKYVPFFGSSELSRIDSFHPSVLAKKYDRGYVPFLLGAPGTQSLSQYFMIHSMGDTLKNKKVVFIISPQWFVKKGMDRHYFKAYFSKLQTFQWLLSIKEVTPEDKYLAQRLLQYPVVASNSTLNDMMTRVAQGEVITSSQHQYAKIMYHSFEKEDQLFERTDIVSKNDRINHQLKKLPADYDLTELKEIAIQNGKYSTSNNSFEIDNAFFKKRVEKNMNRLKDSQVHFDYRYSPEFSDFQLVLNELAKNNVEPLFIIPPVNKKWSDFTGLSTEMLQGFSEKINYQLRSQGFENIADFTKDANVPYFMADTIHLGWQGWLSADQSIAPFLESRKVDRQKYQLSSEFLTKEWQLKNPSDLPIPK